MHDKDALDKNEPRYSKTALRTFLWLCANLAATYLPSLLAMHKLPTGWLFWLFPVYVPLFFIQQNTEIIYPTVFAVYLIGLAGVSAMIRWPWGLVVPICLAFLYLNQSMLIVALSW
jgi:hypothetical protein